MTSRETSSRSVFFIYDSNSFTSLQQLYCRKRFEQSKHGSRVKYRAPSRNLVVPDLLRNKVIGYYRTLSLFQFQSFFSTLFHEQYFLNLLKMIFLHCCSVVFCSQNSVVYILWCFSFACVCFFGGISVAVVTLSVCQ